MISVIVIKWVKYLHASFDIIILTFILNGIHDDLFYWQSLTYYSSMHHAALEWSQWFQLISFAIFIHQSVWENPNGLLGVTFRGALWHGYSCSWTPAALCGEHLLTFFLPKVDIEWRNLCSTYSSNKAEHISEKIFQFYVVLWLSDVYVPWLNVRH